MGQRGNHLSQKISSNFLTDYLVKLSSAMVVNFDWLMADHFLKRTTKRPFHLSLTLVLIIAAV